MSFIDKYYAIFNNSVGQPNVTISRAEFANYLDGLEKECFITYAGVKRSKLPRKLKKRYKKQGVVCFDIVLNAPIIPEKMTIRI